MQKGFFSSNTMTASTVIQAKNKAGNTAMHIACEREDDTTNILAIVQYLVEMGGGGIVAAVNNNGMSPLHVACFAGGNSNSRELV